MLKYLGLVHPSVLKPVLHHLMQGTHQTKLKLEVNKTWLFLWKVRANYFQTYARHQSSIYSNTIILPVMLQANEQKKVLGKAKAAITWEYNRVVNTCSKCYAVLQYVCVSINDEYAHIDLRCMAPSHGPHQLGTITIMENLVQNLLAMV